MASRSRGCDNSHFVLVVKIVSYIIFLNPCAGAVNYCKFTCKVNGATVPHTMCNSSAKVLPPCTDKPFTDGEKRRLVALHNDWRNRVALGLVPRQPPAADMLKVSWDAELEQIARRWARQCRGGHDACRATARFPVGQNIATATFDEIEKTPRGWFKEHEQFDPRAVEKFSFTATTGHYTQVAWASTKYLGCARVDLGPDAAMRTQYVCNYGPAGNLAGKMMYRVGASRSRCPKKYTKKDKEFLGLCVSSRTVRAGRSKHGCASALGAAAALLSWAARRL